MALSIATTQNSSSQETQLPRDYVVHRYHTPRVAIIIPHYNYSGLIGDALLSVQQQTYGNFTCVVVDDHSTEAHFSVVAEEVTKLADDRFKLVRNGANLGQIPSIYRGMEEIDAAFLAILDPDDRYVPEFIARMIAVHLNPLIFCPIVSCDQHLLRIGDGIITATQNTNGLELMMTGAIATEQQSFSEFGFHRFIAPIETGWHWTTTSSMMFRTDALKLIRPKRNLAYKGHADAYFANGAHMMGGTMLLRAPLVYRGIHDDNDFIAQSIFTMFQRQYKANAVHQSDLAKRDVIEAFFANGGLEWFSAGNVKAVIEAQFTGAEFGKLIAEVAGVAKVCAVGA
jgi:glycosyltransferase involved in cell wall biosynthesis